MVQSDIFDAIKNIDEVRKIDDLYLVVDRESNSEYSVESVIFEINKKFWTVTANHDFDEIELKVYSCLPDKTIQQRCSNNLSSLKGLEIGTMFAIVNERGYTDGIKLMLYDHSLKESKMNPFFAVLTIVALASGLQYELRKTGVDTYLI
ncbi:DUF6334 family protein [Acinetobacter nosocomialis]|uniref:DUF6334 family protein n=1 Tax=Acinetobacter nosocomialis TaxID=106654 RepID=UPI001ADB20C2|nr:DUF6334 family protein [Acinetobacter nosocomialis]MBO8207347.1 hypothetical protein [Acinetobacter nosocomialis]MBO8223798.1 hypothetical protein [Acinetobacter nosocomialis]MBO8250893.1 hypothetical protein [Acinetobacter nosocomialis]